MNQSTSCDNLQSKALQDDVEKVAIGAGVSFLGGLAGKGLFLISQVLIARLLGVEGFGVYALGFAVIKVGDIIARIGLNVGGMRFVSINLDDSPAKLKGVLLSASLLSLVNAIFLSFLLHLCSGWLANAVFHKPEMQRALEMFSYSLPFVVLLTTTASLLQGFHILKYTVYSRDLIQPLANIVLIVIFYVYGLSLAGMIYAFVISHVVAVMAALVFLNYLFPAIREAAVKPVFEIRRLVAYSIPLLFVGFLQYLIAWTDTLMLGWLSTNKEVGLYRAAYQLPFAMTIFLAAANAIYAPLAANLYQQNEIERLSFILKGLTRWVTFITLPIFIFIQFSAKEIMQIFGEEYVNPGSLVLIILSFGQLINCITGGVGYTLTMTGRQKTELVNSLILAGASLGLNFWLIPIYGALGAAMASCVATVLINVVRILEIYFCMGIASLSKETYKAVPPVVILFSLMGVINIVAEGAMKITINTILIAGIFVFYYKTAFSKSDEFIKDVLKRKIGFKVPA
jgi:O-antigen/teichoic acid export membrane protein